MMTLPTIALAAFSLTASVGVSEDQLRGSGIHHEQQHSKWSFVGSFTTDEGKKRDVLMTQTNTKAECDELVENNKEAAAEHKVTLSCKEGRDDD